MATNRPGKERSGPSPDQGERRNTLRLSQRDLVALLDGFDLPDRSAEHLNREFIRWPFRRDAVQVLISPPGGGVSNVTMACRNISRNGMSLLHSCYMHPGTKCTVMLPHPERGDLPRPAWVARCEHRSGMVHEIGVSFTTPIDVRDLIRPDPFGDCFSLERVEPEALKGNLLYIDDSEMDVRIVKHFLRGTSLNVRTAGSVADAVAALESPFDIIITDYDLPDGTGVEVLNAVRLRGGRTPVILTTSDSGEATRQALIACPPDACLAKPLTQKLLQRAIGEFLIVKGNGVGSHAGAPVDAEAAALAQSFVGSMRQTIAQLENAIKASNAAHARSICLQISGSAPTVGFPELAEMGVTAARVLERTKSVPESLKSLRTLIAACERLGSRAAA